MHGPINIRITLLRVILRSIYPLPNQVLFLGISVLRAWNRCCRLFHLENVRPNIYGNYQGKYWHAVPCTWHVVGLKYAQQLALSGVSRRPMFNNTATASLLFSPLQSLRFPPESRRNHGPAMLHLAIKMIPITVLFMNVQVTISRSRWPRGLRRGSAAAHFMELRVRVASGTWMSLVSVVFSYRGLGEGWSLAQRSPSLYVCVIRCNNKHLQWVRRRGQTRNWGKKTWKELHLLKPELFF